MGFISVSGIAKGIGKVFGEAEETGESVIDGFRETQEAVNNTIEGAVEGAVNGTVEFGKSAFEAGTKVAETGAKVAIGTTIGVPLVIGKGIVEGTQNVVEGVAEGAQDAVEGFQEGYAEATGESKPTGGSKPTGSSDSSDDLKDLLLGPLMTPPDGGGTGSVQGRNSPEFKAFQEKFGKVTADNPTLGHVVQAAAEELGLKGELWGEKGLVSAVHARNKDAIPDADVVQSGQKVDLFALWQKAQKLDGGTPGEVQAQQGIPRTIQV